LSARLLGTAELVRSRNHFGAVIAGDIGEDVWVVDHWLSPLNLERRDTALVG
jgi:hypothetical protein